MGIHYTSKPIPRELLEEVELLSPMPPVISSPKLSPEKNNIEDKSDKPFEGNRRPSLPPLNLEHFDKNLLLSPPALKTSPTSTINAEASHRSEAAEEILKDEAQANSGDETEGDLFVRNNLYFIIICIIIINSGNPSQVQLARRRQSNFGIKKNRRALPTVPAAVLTRC